MAKICMKCFEIFKDSFELKRGQFNHCPKNNCIGEVVEIDELMLPAIILLNQKGYKTKYCCRGHYGDLEPSAYIKFQQDIELPTIPTGYSICKVFDDNTIRKTLPKMNIEELYRNALELEHWASSLPEHSELREKEELL